MCVGTPATVARKERTSLGRCVPAPGCHADWDGAVSSRSQGRDEPDYLRDVQYGDGARLSARIELHQRFSRNPLGWQAWLFGLLPLAGAARVLDVGCGTASIWLQHAADLPRDMELWLTDFSKGMLDGARRGAEKRGLAAQFAVMNAEELTLAEDSVDVLLASHMLYHVPDRGRAIAEFRRVLRPEGIAVVTTNGREHLRQLIDLMARSAAALSADDLIEQFGLENGASQLGEAFNDVRRIDYDDGLDVNDAEAIIRYLRSMPGAEQLGDDAVSAVRAVVQGAIDRDGAFRITKQSGAFLCQ